MTSDEFRTSVHAAVRHLNYHITGSFRAILEHLVDMPERRTIPALDEVAIRADHSIVARTHPCTPFKVVVLDNETPYTQVMLLDDILLFCYAMKLEPEARFLLLELMGALIIDGKVMP